MRRGGEAHKAFAGSGATGSRQVLPEVWHESVRWTFSLEAAISKEYLSAEDSSKKARVRTPER